MYKIFLEQFLNFIITDNSRINEKVYWISVDIGMLFRIIKGLNGGIEQFTNKFFNDVLNYLNTTTLLISTFNWDFAQTGYFHFKNSPCKSGVIGEQLLKMYSEKRTLDPFYSFIVFGNYEEELTQKKFKNSTGEHSIFEWLVDKNAQLITIGHHYIKAMSSFHHVESIAKVPYRYNKLFSGTVVSSDKEYNLNYTHYVRDLDICDLSGLTKSADLHFRKKNILKNEMIGNTDFKCLIHKVDLEKAHLSMLENLKNNQDPLFINFFGKNKKNEDVITPIYANELFRREYASMKNCI